MAEEEEERNRRDALLSVRPTYSSRRHQRGGSGGSSFSSSSTSSSSDESSSSSSSVSTSDIVAASTEVVVRHHGVTCDECGMYPIVGTRYTAKYIYDYDICETCWIENHEEEQQQDEQIEHHQFVPFHFDMSNIPGGRALANQVCQVKHDNRIVAFTLLDAAEKLERNDTNYPLACFFLRNTYPFPMIINNPNNPQRLPHDHHRPWLRPWQRPVIGGDGLEEDQDDDNDETNNTLLLSKRLCTAIRNNTSIEILRIHMQFNRYDLSQAIIAIGNGLQSNKGIKRVFWNMYPESCTKQTALILHDMIASNSNTIEAFFLGFNGYDSFTTGGNNNGNNNTFGERRRRIFRTATATTTSTTTSSSTTSTTPIPIDDFMIILLNGLRTNTTIRHLRLNGCPPLSSKVMNHLINDTNGGVLKSNTTIQKLNIEFTNPYHSNRLQLFITSQYEQWIQQFANLNLTRNELFHLLITILQQHCFINYNNNNNNHKEKEEEEEEEKDHNHKKPAATTSMARTSTSHHSRSTLSLSSSLDPVAVTYHLLRSRPDFIIPSTSSCL